MYISRINFDISLIVADISRIRGHISRIRILDMYISWYLEFLICTYQEFEFVICTYHKMVVFLLNCLWFYIFFVTELPVRQTLFQYAGLWLQRGLLCITRKLREVERLVVDCGYFSTQSKNWNHIIMQSHAQAHMNAQH